MTDAVEKPSGGVLDPGKVTATNVQVQLSYELAGFECLRFMRSFTNFSCMRLFSAFT